MKKTHKIISFSSEIEDVTNLTRVVKLVGYWANQAGLDGIKITDIRYRGNTGEDPLNIRQEILCDIEITKDSDETV